MTHLKCIIIWLVAMCWYKLVELAPVDHVEELSSSTRRLSNEEMRKIALSCIDEIGINPAVILKAVKGDIPKDNEKYKSFLVCSYKKQGYLSQDGKKMFYDNIFKLLEGYTKQELQNLDKCKIITAETPGDLCIKNLLCILHELLEVEKLRNKHQDFNDTETNLIESED